MISTCSPKDDCPRVFQGFSEDGVPPKPKVNIADERSAGRAYPPIGFDEIGSLPCSPLPVGEADTVVLDEGCQPERSLGPFALAPKNSFTLAVCCAIKE
jgi:hypothetical protein